MKVSKATIVRTILVVVAIINFGLERFGVDIIPVDESTVAMAVEYCIEIAILAVGFWKNNSYSQAAIKADEFLKQYKEFEKEVE